MGLYQCRFFFTCVTVTAIIVYQRLLVGNGFKTFWPQCTLVTGNTGQLGMSALKKRIFINQHVLVDIFAYGWIVMAGDTSQVELIDSVRMRCGNGKMVCQSKKIINNQRVIMGFN